MKITEDDIYWSEEYHHLTILCELEDFEQLKQQIIDEHVKAEKLDSYHYEKQVDELQQEIKEEKLKSHKIMVIHDRDVDLKNQAEYTVKQLKKKLNIE